MFMFVDMVYVQIFSLFCNSVHVVAKYTKRRNYMYEFMTVKNLNEQIAYVPWSFHCEMCLSTQHGQNTGWPKKTEQSIHSIFQDLL